MNDLPDGWTEDDDLIVCHFWDASGTRDSRAVQAKCALCHVDICAFPISVERSKQKGVHLLCRGCLGKLLPSHQVKFAGRVIDNRFPESKQ